ncbi:MAG: EF-hand domain-containing protein [Betaproteobacteria bacterium]|nr:MAG: EF-hand domain-containing protein [Betaproteobacteria bacterium]
MKLAKSAAFAVAALAFALGSAYGATAKSQDKDPGFNALDTNHDGQLSKSEAAGNPYLAKRFKTTDKNHDGKLSRTEYLAVMARKDLRTVKDKVSHALGSKESSSSAGGSSTNHTKSQP